MISTTRSSGLRMMTTPLAILVAIMALAAAMQPVEGAATCAISTQITEEMIRSTDDRGLVVQISGDTLVTTGLPANAVTDLNTNLASANPGLSPEIQVESLMLVTNENPNKLQLIFKQGTTYDISANETVTLSLLPSFFVGGVACSALVFDVEPTAGTLTHDLPAVGLTETTINSRGLNITFGLQHEHFNNSDILIQGVFPEGLHFNTSLINETHLQVTILLNTTLNIAQDAQIPITFSLSNTSIRSGIIPIIINKFLVQEIVLVIKGDRPTFSAVAEAGAAQASVTAEDVWDGKVVLQFELLGDVFIQDPSLWTNNNTGPEFTSPGPPQTFGFKKCLENYLFRPNVTFLTNRKIEMRWPECYGYSNTIINIGQESVKFNRLNMLIQEGVDIEGATILITRAKEANLAVEWYGRPFDTPVYESEIRKSGFSVAATLKYDVFTTAVGRDADARGSPTRAGAFDPPPSTLLLNGLIVSFTNITTLNLTIPAQDTYDIDADELIALTIPKALLANSWYALPRPSSNFTLKYLSTQSTCSINGHLDESRIRTDPNITISVDIDHGADTFCFHGDEAITQDFEQNMCEGKACVQTSSNQFDTSTSLSVVVVRTQTDPSKIVFAISQNPSYDISGTAYVKVELPRNIMCSLEVCKAKDGDASNTLSIPIQPTKGVLSYHFPLLDETYLRGSDLSVSLELNGESFKPTSTTAEADFMANFIITSHDPDRGFKNSFVKTSNIIRDPANSSRATLTLYANESYDITKTETIAVNFDVNPGTILQSRLPPDVSPTATPLIINGVRGSVRPDGFHFDTNSAQFNESLGEEEIIAGGYTFRFRLLNERWNHTLAGPNIVGTLQTDSQVGGMSSSTNREAVFGPGAFTYNLNSDPPFGTLLVISFQACPQYDITIPDEFRLSFTGISTASGRTPDNSSYYFFVIPAPSRLIITGSAINTDSQVIVRGGATISLQVKNDAWDEKGLDVLTNEAMCAAVPSGECTTEVTDGGRLLTLTFKPNTNYYITANKEYVLVLREKYFKSGVLPEGEVRIKVTVSSGILAWRFTSAQQSVVDEDIIRDGLLSTIEVKVDGDRFSDVASLRSSLVNSVSCTGQNDELGFCSRAQFLFGGSEFVLSTGTLDEDRTLTFALQADPDYDVYQSETVTIRLDRSGLQSRKDPALTDSLTFTINPSPGRFFLSGSYNGMTQKDLLTEDSAKEIKLVLTLHGERWLPNSTMILAAFLTQPPADPTQEGEKSRYYFDSTLALSKEPDGFLAKVPEIITAEGTTVSAKGRVLTLQFRAAPTYTIVTPAVTSETITISIPPKGVLSSFSPVLQSGDRSFPILFIGGEVSCFPTSFTAEQLQEEGMVFEFALKGSTWGAAVQDKKRIDSSIRTGSSPQSEPNGFAVYRTLLMTHLQNEGVSFANGTGNLVFNFTKAPSYSLIRPETLTIQMSKEWSGANRPLVPDVFDVTIFPNFYPVQATVFCSDGTFHEEVWIQAVAERLGVLASSIEIESVQAEPFIPGSTQHKRVSFRIKAPEDPTVPYDNQAAKIFMSYDRDLHERAFNTVTAFYNRSAPPDSFWADLQVTGNAPTEEPNIALNSNLLWIFVGVLVLLFAAVAGILKYRQGALTTGLRRTKVGGGKQGAEAVLNPEREEFLDENAVYAGQTRVEARLDGTQTGKGLLAVPMVGGVALVGGGVDNERQARAAEKQQKQQQEQTAFSDHDLPLLYAGQRSRKADTNADGLTQKQTHPWSTVQAPDMDLFPVDDYKPPHIVALEKRAKEEAATGGKRRPATGQELLERAEAISGISSISDGSRLATRSKPLPKISEDEARTLYPTAVQGKANPGMYRPPSNYSGRQYQ